MSIYTPVFFTWLCVFRTRLAGLKGLRAVIKKIGRQDGVQLNIWDIDHMNKIVPPFLFNMQQGWQQRHERREQGGDTRPVQERYDVYS